MGDGGDVAERLAVESVMEWCDEMAGFDFCGHVAHHWRGEKLLEHMSHCENRRSSRHKQHLLRGRFIATPSRLQAPFLCNMYLGGTRMNWIVMMYYTGAVP